MLIADPPTIVVPSIIWQEVGGGGEDARRRGFVPGAALTNAFAQPKMGSFPAEGSEPEARRRAQHRALVVRPTASTLAPRAGDARLTRTTESSGRSAAQDLGRMCSIRPLLGGPGVDGI